MRFPFGAVERIAVWGGLAVAAVVLIRLERRVASVEQHVPADGAAVAAPAVPNATVTAATVPTAAAKPVSVAPQQAFIRAWFPSHGETAEKKCWGAVERSGKRVPGALWFEVTFDASGALTAATVDLGALEGFTVPPELVDCIAGLMKAVRFPANLPPTARIQVDRKRID